MRRTIRTLALAALPILWAAAAAAPATAQVVQEAVDLDVIRAIREEGFERSQIEALAGHLTDVIGPRLTGSPGMRRANRWTAETFRAWGLENVVIEPWGEFGRGWRNVSFRGRLLEPYLQILSAWPVAWTGSTNGPARGPAVVIEVDSAADLERYRGKLKGAFVLATAPPTIEPEWGPRALRLSTEELLAPPEPREMDPEQRRRMIERFRRRRALRDTVSEFLADEGVAAILSPSSRTYGILRVGGNSAGRDPTKPIPIPELVLTHEGYGQIYRNVKRGVPVTLEVDVKNEFFEDDLKAYNTLAEIPGADLADEYVMIGAHLDSWHAGTGATDNGAGTIVTMEAIRILKALGLKPRRTIRIALWSGEEQGLLGSRAWLEKHKDLWPKISAYLNVDHGTGRIRGIRNQGNEAAVPIFEAIFWALKDLGVVAVRRGSMGGSDHLSFDRVGIPGFAFVQDPIEYSSRTHHTYADRYERLVIDDLKQAAVVVAVTAYHLAMRDEMMPRKPEEEETVAN
jgi:hypothetical protein